MISILEKLYAGMRSFLYELQIRHIQGIQIFTAWSRDPIDAANNHFIIKKLSYFAFVKGAGVVDYPGKVKIEFYVVPDRVQCQLPDAFNQINKYWKFTVAKNWSENVTDNFQKLKFRLNQNSARFIIRVLTQEHNYQDSRIYFKIRRRR